MKALLVVCANQIRVNEGFHHHNLKITNAEDDFFGHKAYREWADDVLTMFEGDHVVAQYAIILTLTNEHFHADMGVRSMLEKAITLYPIKRELVDLEDAQIKYWADKDMLPSNVFRWLNFNKDNVLDRRLLAQWTAFLTHRHENSLDKDLVDDEKVYEMLIKEMAKMDKTSDLVDIIVKAEKKNPSQPIWKTTAWDYGLALFKTWSSEGKSDEYILSLLKIQTNELPLKNPLVTLWIHYMKEKKVDPVHLLFPRLHEYYKDPKELENAIAAENIQWQLRAN
ncbi:unnamed protein product [Peronospora belbahrii]|uniref:Uncharacterized protein n=1 Tax=Peronospora belbahrii TaxID=622444 RepID=A0ABN8D4T1_9STRA|nr:unnamed protein product [Peronospora belbahrii]